MYALTHSAKIYLPGTVWLVPVAKTENHSHTCYLLVKEGFIGLVSVDSAPHHPCTVPSF